MLRTLPLIALTLTGCKEPVVVQSYLALVNISPASGSAGVNVDAQIIATFSEDLDADTVDAQTTYMEDQDRLPVVATVAYDEATWSIFIVPETTLAEDMAYTVTFTRDIAGIESGALGAVINSDFATGGSVPQNEIPVAIAGMDQPGTVGTKVKLDGSASIDPEGEILLYAWRLVTVPSGAEAELTRENSAKTSFTPDLPGEYVVGLTVNDEIEDSSEDFVAILVSNAPDVPEDTGGEAGGDTGG